LKFAFKAKKMMLNYFKILLINNLNLPGEVTDGEVTDGELTEVSGF
jgi:hypothetical protein